MAHSYLKNYMRTIPNLNMPITDGPMWQRKVLSPVKSVNGRRQTPYEIGCDRFIPARNSQQMEVANFLLTQRHQPVEEDTAERQKAWSVALNGFDIEEAKILPIGGKQLNAPEGYLKNVKVRHSQPPFPVSKKRYIFPAPFRVLDAPDLNKDFYLNLLDWSSHSLIALALHNDVYLYDVTTRDVRPFLKMENETDYICSLSWSEEGHYLAIGTSDSTVQLWDVEQKKHLRTLRSHSSRVGSLSWNDHILSSGSGSGQIHHHDVRIKAHHICRVTGHSQDVCGLKWSSDGRYLASGGKDNLVHVWPRVQKGGARSQRRPLHSWRKHQGAVKALAWCPWAPNILATGGGGNDKQIHIWNVNNGSCMNSLDTQSQVSSMVFSPHSRELVSAHGWDGNNVVVWKYPSLTKVAELTGHEDIILSLVLSPDQTTIMTVAADETLRMWKIDEVKQAPEMVAISWMNQLMK